MADSILPKRGKTAVNLLAYSANCSDASLLMLSITHLTA
ncbi:MAG: hypothetical protein OJF49_000014 [Ktedonobacterales bacterium]|nr:MAG: hypothetical protein OJF49_000014 [Ktedonobacterales bacterium]